MTEYGLVVKTENQTAFVRFIRSSACGKCKACGMLSTQNEIIVEVPNDIGARVGEYVQVSIVMKKAIKASAIAYMFPLVMLFAGVLFGWLLTDVWHIFVNRDPVMAICALIFAVLSFLLLKIASPLYNKTVRRVYTMIGVKKDEDKEIE
ncbi:MAG: SoxR reducing system RseC family protein [Clostridia bacterium]|jgi:sigma-E factor negative regulatory protein RseC|nr:SoxR reducing system RseC family protein [Clostridia bacterium]MBT7123182.1 SoxR reducing system RseC family protein [Clostridia bacterium]